MHGRGAAAQTMRAQRGDGQGVRKARRGAARDGTHAETRGQYVYGRHKGRVEGGTCEVGGGTYVGQGKGVDTAGGAASGFRIRVQ